MTMREELLSSIKRLVCLFMGHQYHHYRGQSMCLRCNHTVDHFEVEKYELVASQDSRSAYLTKIGWKGTRRYKECVVIDEKGMVHWDPVAEGEHKHQMFLTKKPVVMKLS